MTPADLPDALSRSQRVRLLGKTGRMRRSVRWTPFSPFFRSADFSSTVQSPFDRLPDETVAQILSFALIRRRRSSSDLPLFLVNKRFNRIVTPLFSSAQVSDTSVYVGPPTAIKKVFYWPSVDAPRPFCTAPSLALFPNLTAVKLNTKVVSDATAAATVPTSVTSLLTRLPHLETLGFEFWEDFVLEDKAFSIESLPTLRRLELGEGCQSSAQQLNAPHARLRELQISNGADDPSAHIPWSILVSLEMWAYDFPRDHDALVQSMIAAVSARLFLFFFRSELMLLTLDAIDPRHHRPPAFAIPLPFRALSRRGRLRNSGHFGRRCRISRRNASSRRLCRAPPTSCSTYVSLGDSTATRLRRLPGRSVGRLSLLCSSFRFSFFFASSSGFSPAP
jgi:hypothetical protein